MSDVHSRYCAMIERFVTTEQVWREYRNACRAERRRELYRTDPLWRLSKLKANREHRMRAKLCA